MTEYLVDPTLDDTIELLSSCRTRCILYHFLEANDDTSSIDELCDHILDHDPQANDRGAVMTDLHHRTLPKLASNGYIDYDWRSGAVRFQEDTESVKLASSIMEVEVTV